jgi:hypothetical protein
MVRRSSSIIMRARRRMWYAPHTQKAVREDHVQGAMVLPVAFGFLFAIWVLVIYGSSFFGPKT